MLNVDCTTKAVSPNLKVLMLLVAFVFTIPFVNAVPPTNFQLNLVIGSGLDEPTGFDIAPDGRIFILERDGRVKIYKNGQLLSEPFVTLPSITTGDRGLLGIAFDPEFQINHWVYFYHTGTDKMNRLVRFDASTDKAQNGPVIIYQTSTPSEQLHVGGTVAFGKDGKIYLSIGDNGYPPNAQSRSNPFGKIMRINKDGSIPPENPFVGQGGLPEIWVLGLRNPFRFSVDSATGSIYEGDVGHNDWEEVNRIFKGGNYGWPECEGYCDKGFINPQFAYNHYDSNGNYISSSVTTGPVYRGTMFPPEYRDSLFFADYARGFIKRMDLDSNGDNEGIYDFDLNAGSVVDMKLAKDGSLYYVTYYPGRIYRITYSIGNQIPVANAQANVTKGVEPLPVKFSSSGSYDPNGDSITFSWKFGDGATSTSANPTKVYSNKGTYTVEMTVSDGQSSAQAVPIVIQVGVPPNVTIGSPQNNSLYNAGNRIIYTASATDGAGGDIADANISTTVLFHHDTHVHPFLGPVKGRNGFFDIPITGEPSASTYYEIRVTATDTNGLSTTKFVNIIPRKSNMTFTTNPAGMEIRLDGQPILTPFTVTGVVNSSREISAEVIQYNGKTYQFASWSDGGGATHSIRTPSTATTYTANYVEMPDTGFTGEYFSNKFLSGSPTFTRTDPKVDFDFGAGSPDPRIPSDGFSARWTKIQPFEAGTYKFSVTSDDGFRLKINGNILLDKFFDQPATTYNVDVALGTGNHSVVMEYYENTGLAVAKLSWTNTFENYFNSDYHLGSGNAYWQEVNVVPKDGRPVKQVYMRFNEGEWIPMEKKSWGNWASNRFAPKGTRVEFLVLDQNNIISQSKIFYWLFGATSQDGVIPNSFPSRFFLSSSISNYWAEVNAASPFAVTKVEMSIDGGAYIALEKKSWGNWAKGGTFISSDSNVLFRATDTSGRIAFSRIITWP